MTPVLTQCFAGHGIRFDYPAGWQVTEEQLPDQWVATLESGQSAFWQITIFDEPVDVIELMDSVVETYRSEYPNLDETEPVVTLFRSATEARDLDFICLDLVVTACIRAFDTEEQTMLVLYQGEDRELERLRPVLDAISQSLRPADQATADGLPLSELTDRLPGILPGPRFAPPSVRHDHDHNHDHDHDCGRDHDHDHDHDHGHDHRHG